jgi:spore coat protein CotH
LKEVTPLANHKYFDRICISISVVTILIALVYSYLGPTLGVTQSPADLSYTTTLFDDSSVHTINIQIDENAWNDLQENASDEAYQQCAVTIDGETVQNVAIRAKGNSDSERYSFKVDFNKYNDGTTYHGLDKLNLNNIIQDNTYLKDYLCYDMMRYMGVAAPLTSFTRISINGEYFGLYLAVEGVEQAFAARNYGSDTGNIYKPESSEIGGDMGDAAQAMGGGGDMPDMSQPPDGTQLSNTKQTADTAQTPNNTPPTDAVGNGQTQMPDMTQLQNTAGGGGGMGGDSGNDVALIYSDNQTSSYDHIWDGAVFDITSSDQTTLIDSIKQLNEGENLDQVVDVDEVLKYFVVHSFVDNYDSYTGSMKHNYYLREDDGKLSIIAWDYNLAFNTFMGGGMGGDTATTTTSTVDDATLLVNYPIDTPVYGTTMEERPLLNALLSNEEYLKRYHQYYQEFISGYFDSGRCDETIDSGASLIASSVETDPTAFCTYQEYQDGVAALKSFCALRVESISGQLDGTIPATTSGQTAQSTTLIDASAIDLSVMGSSMSGGDGMNANGVMTVPTAEAATTAQTATASDSTAATGNTQKPANGGQPPTLNTAGGNTANGPSGGPSGPNQGSTADGTASAAADNTADTTTTGTTNTTSEAAGQAFGMLKGSENNTSVLNQNLPALILLGSSLLLLGGGLLATKLFRRKI